MLGAASLLMFPALLFALFVGFPVAFAMIAVAFGFGYWAFGPSIIFQFVQKIDAMASNFVLAAVPLFIFMGAMLERAGIAERLFEAIHLWTRRLPGGLAIGTVLMCVVFAASSGVIGAPAPTEAAALGALGALLLSVIYGGFSLKVLHESLVKTLRVTVMILTILMAGNMFAGVFIAGGGVQTTEQLIAAANLGPWLTLGLFLLVCFLAGFILDWISILLIFIPVFMPIMNKMGFEPVWFCVLFLI